MKVMISAPFLYGKETEMNMALREKFVQHLTAKGYTVMGTTVDTPPEGGDADLWRLGQRLQTMSMCDGVCFAPGWEQSLGCRIEYMAASLSGLSVL